MLAPAGDAILASCSNETAPGRIETKRHRAFPLDTVVPNPLSLMCFRKDQLIRVKNVTALETCVFFGHVAVSCCAERSLSSVTSGPKRRPRRAFAQTKSGPRAV
jgi:hypothetical protein